MYLNGWPFRAEENAGRMLDSCVMDILRVIVSDLSGEILRRAQNDNTAHRDVQLQGTLSLW